MVKVQGLFRVLWTQQSVGNQPFTDSLSYVRSQQIQPAARPTGCLCEGLKLGMASTFLSD